MESNNEALTDQFINTFKTAMLAVKRVINEQLDEDLKEWQETWEDENETRIFNIETAMLANNKKEGKNQNRIEDLEAAISHMTGDIDRLNIWEIESADQKK